MKFIGNVLWLIPIGLDLAIAWFFLGIFWCITIIGIPFGKQCFKLARLSTCPFGTTVDSNFGTHPIANIIWIIFGGIFFAIFLFFLGLILCIIIIGIPFGKQCFKLAKLAVAPFGTTIQQN